MPTDPGQIKAQFLNRLGDRPAWFHIFDNLPDIYFFMKNRKGEIMAGNSAFVELMGCRSETEIIGKTAYDLCPPNLADSYTQDDELVMHEGRELVNRVELNYGREIDFGWMVTCKSPLYDRAGKIIGLIGVTRDTGKAQMLSTTYAELQPAVEYIQAHFRESIDIATLARQLHMSQSKLERGFKKQFGLSPLQYIMRQRVNAAAEELLHSSKSITDIALEVGFYDHSTLTRHFTKHRGVSPSVYRQQANRT